MHGMSIPVLLEILWGFPLKDYIKGCAIIKNIGEGALVWSKGWMGY